MTPCQVANPVLEPGNRLIGDASLWLRFVPDREPKDRLRLTATLEELIFDFGPARFQSSAVAEL
ncbi:MAG: hypothetical protein JO227_00980 [Acetobacteraceae bacterium]|nr:hypothetical protein [Acetobacteraceae bacterium]